MQSPLRLIYPSQCMGCGAEVAGDDGLCPECWRATWFIRAPSCDSCGAPLPGQSDGLIHCDDCLRLPRPWHQGRAALRYRDTGRRLVLALKHGDRLDLARPLARWMAPQAAPLLTPDHILVPVPAHWTRTFKRRYNQAAELARALATLTAHPVHPTALVRTRATPTQEGRSHDHRFANVTGSIAPHPRRGAALHGKRVLLIDDVMASGATFTAATEACLIAGAASVDVLALARVVKGD